MSEPKVINLDRGRGGIFRAPVGEAIRKMRSLSTPDILGEWHPETQQVYIANTRTKMAMLLAEGVDNPDLAQLMFGCWIKGYKAGQAPRP